MNTLVTQVRGDILEKVCKSWEDAEVAQLIAQLQSGTLQATKFNWENGKLTRKGRLVVGPDPELRKEILTFMHASSFGEHSGVHATYKRVTPLFYWKKMKKDIRNLVRNCHTCQKNKPLLRPPAGLLQPLPVPDAIWTDISLDFVEGLPKFQGKDTILVVVDRLSKYAHFLLLTHPFDATTVARLYFEQVFKLHGSPKTIVSDRDKIFLSKFWQEFFKLQHVDLHMSTAYHPQTDGQTEVVNKCLETYLKCMTGERPKEWVGWIPLAEWWYNSNFHSSSGITPYEVVYGQAPQLHIPYVMGDSRVAAVDRSLAAREECIKMLKFHLKRAQDRIKTQSDKHRSDVEFEEGDWVYVKLQPYRQQSVARRSNQKLAPKYFGPFSVEKRVGKVAYKLILPVESRIHPVFHVSQLRKHHGTPPVTATVPEIDDNLMMKAEPLKLLERKMVKKGAGYGVHLLIQWANGDEADATWEEYDDFTKRYPNFSLG
ncbi:hypothetical protein RND81_11G097100 [Saponaria officinalis]|uniref:Integrase catalytic domain-containing protein n=1 Tax=Saponaria officinalis TaxID=3572 RepID=A0AAW1HJZ1_SAPOF